jgi:WD40 repeat protein
MKTSMNKKTIAGFLCLWTVILAACGGNSPAPLSNDQMIETIVAGTMNAVSSSIPSETATPQTVLLPTVTILPSETPMPTEQIIPTATLDMSTVLPKQLFFMAADSGGQWQIHRLDRDGSKIKKITDVDKGISGFDVSPVDGSIVYTSNNRLFTINRNGKDRQELIKNVGALGLFSPLWTPDGGSIVYRLGKDTSIYNVVTQSRAVLVKGSEVSAIQPVAFSPDGQKLLLHRQDGYQVIYDLSTKTFVEMQPFESVTMQIPGCHWNDPQSLFCNTHVLAGAILPGLWRVNADSGIPQALLWSRENPFPLVAAPRQDPAGNLYFLFGKTGENLPEPPLSFVRSEPDGVTNRTSLRPEIFQYVRDAFWIPDNRGLIITQSIFHSATQTSTENMLLVPMNPTQPVVTLLADQGFMYDFRWGP